MRVAPWLVQPSVGAEVRAAFALLLICAAVSRAALPAEGVRVTRLQPGVSSKSAGFTEIPVPQTAVVFSNVLDDRTVLKNQNLMLGSGVAAGDFDGDGWCDLYFCAVNGSNALFRNLGDWKFENVTIAANAALADHASTGTVFADVDGDGDLDLLASSLGRGVTLLQNEGGKFHDITAEAGLSSRSGAMTMALGDVDGDGDLDLFVCNYGAQALLKAGVEFQVKTVNGRQTIIGPQAERLRIQDGKLVELGEPPVLYLNDGRGRFTAEPWNSARFLDEAGQPLQAPWDFGLSAQMRDVNGDGAPDLYVCNDFDTPDRFWINDGRGHFRLIPKLAQRSQSYASMGVDFADIDRDGHLDFFVVEMLAADRARRLWQSNPLTGAAFRHASEDRPEIARNTLFHARGDGTFEEIANYAGVAASDWSWQGAFVDVDLDGFEDLLVVNGHLFDVQDMDVPPPRTRRTEDIHAQLLASPRLLTPKKAWRNRGDLRFEDVSARWGFHDTNLCHGMALADLDRDGDLDVIGNRMNAGAWLLRNDSPAPRVAVRLKGHAPNTRGIGARVTLRGGAVPQQTQEIISGGKYLSSDEAVRVFAARGGGTGGMTLDVLWRSGARTTITNVEANRHYEISESTAAAPAFQTTPAQRPSLLIETAEQLKHTHVDGFFDDFRLQPLLTRKLSQRGPGLCVTDLDGDGHEDLLVGGGRGGRMTYYRNDGRGNFTLAAESAPLPDDVVSLVEWTPGRGVRGVLASLANYETTASNLPILFVTLEEKELVFNAIIDIPELRKVRASAYALAVSDFDSDGDLDVFLGGHAVSGRYPEAAPSWILRNDQTRLRLDEPNSAVLTNAGLINSSLWTDLDGDGWPELALAREWGSICIFRNERGRLFPWVMPVVSAGTRLTLDKWTGWWSGITSADFDGDGRMDLLVGNWGLNGPQRATTDQPLTIFYGDWLDRGGVDLLETEYDGEGREWMNARPLGEIAACLPPLRQRFTSHRAWAATPVKEVLASYRNVQQSTANVLATTVFLNRGASFEARSLPREAQLSPSWSVNAADFDGDGHVDIFLSQNFFALRSDHPRLDSGRGLLLRGDGQGSFSAMAGADSGLFIHGEQRGAVTGDFDGDGRTDLIASQNAGATKLFRNAQAAPGMQLRLRATPDNPHGIGAAARFRSGTNSSPVHAVHGGSGWMSHNSSVLVLAPPAGAGTVDIEVQWPGGRRSRSTVPSKAQRIDLHPNGTWQAR